MIKTDGFDPTTRCGSMRFREKSLFGATWQLLGTHLRDTSTQLTIVFNFSERLERPLVSATKLTTSGK